MTGLTMKAACLLSTLLIFGSIASSGQDCKSEEPDSLPYLKGAIQRVKDGPFLSFDDKAFNRSGDLAAVAILKTIPESEMASPATVKTVLLIIRSAFGCPARCVATRIYQKPNITLLLLEHLGNGRSGQMRSAIEETRKYVVDQTRDIE